MFKMINKIKSNIFQLYFKGFGSVVYLLKIKNQNIIIDTSSSKNEKELINNLEQLNLNPKDIDIIILTHQHWDHNENINLFKNAKLYKYENINQLPIKEFKIIKTPGHTKDSIVILYKKILFSGDTLFHNGIGRTDFSDSEPKKMNDSLKKLKNLNYQILCPGHVF